MIMRLYIAGIWVCMLFKIGYASGLYFTKSKRHEPLPEFDALRSELPCPIYKAEPVFIDMYWKSWQLAFQNFYRPTMENGFVSNYIDAAFNRNIFLWDTCFMTMFCNYAYPIVPGIESLDNFYVKQHADGEICREISHKTGSDFTHWINHEHLSLFSRCGWIDPGSFWHTRQRNSVHPVRYQNRTRTGVPDLTLDALNHPILAWAEWEYLKISNDSARLAKIWSPLHRYFQALDRFLRQGNGLYVTDWASMDNSPRNAWLNQGGCGVDISCEMALFADVLFRMAVKLDKKKDAEFYKSKHQHIRKLVNRLMWDGNSRFYYDLTVNGKKSPVKTIAAFWTLIAGVPDSVRAGKLVSHLTYSLTFHTLHRVPTLARDHPDYHALGGYWRGAVWAPTNTMVIRGCERYGMQSLAYELAMQHLSAMATVFGKTGTIWENYAAEKPQAGQHPNGTRVKSDFVGWSGMGPILYLLEFAIGIKADAFQNQITWTLHSAEKVGCKGFCFNNNHIDLIAYKAKNDKRKVEIRASKRFTLIMIWKDRIKKLHPDSGQTCVELNTSFYNN